MHVKRAQGQPKVLKNSELKFQLGVVLHFPRMGSDPLRFPPPALPQANPGPTLPSAGCIMHDDRGNQQPTQAMAFREACPGTPSTPPQLSFQPT